MTNTIILSALALIFLLSIKLQITYGAIIISWKEEQCLEKTGAIFESSEKDLAIARHDFSSSMVMEMTSKQKMYASYPEAKLKRYDEACTKHGGKLHIIKLDFFDCQMKGAPDDVELTLKNFANCMAAVEECEGFGQEHLLQEAWGELGLHCVEEAEETKKDPPSNNKNDANNSDIAKKEKEAASKGSDEVDKEERNKEYVPKEKQSSSSSKSRGGFRRFTKILLFASICAVVFFVIDRRRRGLPIQMPSWIPTRFGGSSLPFGGVTVSRFQSRGQPQTGFVSNYNLLSGDEEEINYNVNNELQLSSNLTT